jgi:hypothetical protein
MLISFKGKSVDTAQAFIDIVCEFGSAVARSAGYTNTLEQFRTVFLHGYPKPIQHMCYAFLEILCEKFSEKVSKSDKEQAVEEAASNVFEMVLTQRRVSTENCSHSLLRKDMTVGKLMEYLLESTCVDCIMANLVHLRQVCKTHISSKVHAFKLVLSRKKSAKSVLGELSKDIVDMICRHIETMAVAELRQHLQYAVDAVGELPPSSTARTIQF